MRDETRRFRAWAWSARDKARKLVHRLTYTGPPPPEERRRRERAARERLRRDQFEH